MKAAMAALTLGAVLGACQAAPPVVDREMLAVTGPGWSAGLPADLGLEPLEPSAGGTSFVRLRDVDAGITLEILRDDIGLDESLEQLRSPGGQGVLRQEPVAMPVGRAVYLELGPGGRATHGVLAEPRAGVLVIVSSTAFTAADLVTIARTVRVDE